MKSLVISLIAAIFLISCAPVIRPYKEMNFSYIIRRRAALKEQIDKIKTTKKYQKETVTMSFTYPVIIPLCIFGRGACEHLPVSDLTPEHSKVWDLKREYDDLGDESKYFKHCFKDN